MAKPRVFIIQEPTKWDEGTRTRVRSMDLTPAQEFGELVFVVPPEERPPSDPRGMLTLLRRRLSDFGQHDFLLLTGHPILIACAGVVAAQRTGGPVKLLHWERGQRRYLVNSVDLGDEFDGR